MFYRRNGFFPFFPEKHAIYCFFLEELLGSFEHQADSIVKVEIFKTVQKEDGGFEGEI